MLLQIIHTSLNTDSRIKPSLIGSGRKEVENSSILLKVEVMANEMQVSVPFKGRAKRVPRVCKRVRDDEIRIK